MIVLDVDNILLPSVNQKFGGVNPKTGKLFIANKYKRMADIITSLIRMRNNVAPVPAPYVVRISVETYLDIDNFIKATLDSLKKSFIINDDKNVLRLEVDKKYRKKGGGSRIRVEVESYCADNYRREGVNE